MDRTRIEGIIRAHIIFHEQVHDELVVEHEELISAIAGAIEKELTEELSKTTGQVPSGRKRRIKSRS